MMSIKSETYGLMIFKHICTALSGRHKHAIFPYVHFRFTSTCQHGTNLDTDARSMYIFVQDQIKR